MVSFIDRLNSRLLLPRNAHFQIVSLLQFDTMTRLFAVTPQKHVSLLQLHRNTGLFCCNSTEILVSLLLIHRNTRLFAANPQKHSSLCCNSTESPVSLRCAVMPLRLKGLRVVVVYWAVVVADVYGVCLLLLVVTATVANAGWRLGL